MDHNISCLKRLDAMSILQFVFVVAVLLQSTLGAANDAVRNIDIQSKPRPRFPDRNRTRNSAGIERPRIMNALVPGSSNWTMARVEKNNSTQSLITKLRSMHIQTNPQRTHREPIPNNTNVMEVMMMRREMETFSKTLQVLHSKNYSIRGFYHTSAWQTYWKDVISEQLLLLDGKRKIPVSMDASNSQFVWDRNHTWTSLLNASDSLYMNVAGPDIVDLARIQEVVNSLNLDNVGKILFNFNYTVGRGTFNGADPVRKEQLLNNTEVSEGEYTTTMELQRYCKQMTAEGKKAVVYYMHNKGGCCFKRNPNDRVPVHAWRDAMNAMIVEFPSVCSRALMKGYSSCGAENQDGHYSGNFWWAECEHVAHIGPLPTRFNAWDAEYFVQKVNPHNGDMNKRFGYQCGYSVHNCGLNLYDHECKREFYREKLYRYTSGKLGPNMVATKVNDTSLCREVRKRPYANQYEYLEKHLLHSDKLHGGPKHRRRLTCFADDY